ncbi:radical SAM family heme chaperone HemW [Sporichthya sp.]|uniref:radical SAM family heme chaperone HemW n=1 Tax=Sporichthya sp. TaxID=65475 RepID=UPI0017EBCEA6|nr:radical SAM family heme chaperone HemW [Sporichthya sp.]MBA3745679.1 coproporphyrinogen III oxidase [Sporichthya sp.]
MAGQPPSGEPVPTDGALPGAALAGLGERPFGIYLHVPFCASRCGYCDFNTYTATELGPGLSRDGYPDLAAAEIRFAAKVLAARGAVPEVSTVFVGGGTPTLLTPCQLGGMLAVVREEFGLAPDAEVSVESNPDSVDGPALDALVEAGFTRISFGMQSSANHVLAVLDRTHTPGRAAECARWARAAGFAGVNLDLIYGSPGESDADWAGSISSALDAQPDHISAYALILEEGTRLAAQVRRGVLPAPDDDVLAARYETADAAFSAAGLSWYEVSNWAASPAARCRHNEGYWAGGDWWGIGPGAHSHVGGVRWWNVRHPRDYASRIGGGLSPGAGRELLTAAERDLERVLLGIRLVEGFPLVDLDEAGRTAAVRAGADGLLEPAALDAGRAVLTLRGRLLADAVVRELT